MFYSAFKNGTGKVVLLRLEVKGLIKSIEKFRAEKTFLSPNILLRGMKYRLRKQL